MTHDVVQLRLHGGADGAQADGRTAVLNAPESGAAASVVAHDPTTSLADAALPDAPYGRV